MRYQSLTAASLMTLVAAGAAIADPATPDIARSIEQGYAAYLTKLVVDKGIVSVAIDGDSYVVTWNLQKAIDMADAPPEAIKIGKFVYKLTPGVNGVWTLKGDSFPNFSFKDGDKPGSSGAMAVKGFHIDGVYDPKAAEFVKAKAVAEKIEGAFPMEQSGQTNEVKFTQDGLALEFSAKPAADGAGVDVALKQALKGLVETVGPAASEESGGGAVKSDDDSKSGAAASEPAAEGMTMTYKMSGVTGQSLLVGLRAQEIGDLWKYTVQHVGDAHPPADLKARLKSALPLWKDLSASADVKDLSVETPLGSGTAKSFGETLHMSGFTEKGVAQIAFKFDTLEVKSPMMPPWAEPLSKVSVNFDVGASSDGWDKIANIVLDDPKFGEKGDMSAETTAAVMKVLIGGSPKFTLAPGRLTTSVIDLTFEGSATMTGGAPKGALHITADSLDKTMALLAEAAKDQQDAQGAMLGMTFIKGLAKAGDGGRMVWDVEVDAKGAVKINGQLLPTGK